MQRELHVRLHIPGRRDQLPLSNPHYSHLVWDDTHAVQQKDGGWTITQEYLESFHQASRGGLLVIPPWQSPPYPQHQSPDRSGSPCAHPASSEPTACQPSPLANWESSLSFEPTSDLFQSTGTSVGPWTSQSFPKDHCTRMHVATNSR